MPRSSDTSREPCPHRIIDDVGVGFGIGAIGGSAFHMLRGAYNSPKGERLVGGTQAIRMNVPRIGGSFAAWSGLFSAFDCSMVYLRQKEDPWNSIISGAAAGGILQLRQGIRVAARSAVYGGVLLAMIEGTGIMLNKFVAVQQESPIFLEDLLGGNPPEAAASSSSWFGGLFGRGKEEEEKKKKSPAGAEILESFEAPIPPTFEYK